MSTLDDLVNEVHLNLLGYVEDQEQITPLAGNVADDDTSFSVVDAEQMSSGLIEIDDELMWCSRVDLANNIVHVVSRGMYGTTAAAHTAPALVRNAPRFPRFSIKRAINDTIRATYPALFAVASTTFTYQAATVAYELPAAVEMVYDVSQEDAGGTDQWVPIRSYQVNLNANVAAFATGKSIDIEAAALPGGTINVVYRKRPSVLTAGDDDFTDSGLEDSAKECIIYGALARLVGYIEPARMSDFSASAKLMEPPAPGTALATARYFYQMHRLMLDEESRRLLDRYPPRLHFQR